MSNPTPAPAPQVVTTDSPLPDRIALGIAWLDDVRPDWRAEIVLPDLDMSDSTKCVLGQVFYMDAFTSDPYWGGFDHVMNSGYYKDAAGDSLTAARAVRHGFDTEVETYASLTAAWEAALDDTSQTSDTCSHCGTPLVAEDCPNYGFGEVHA